MLFSLASLTHVLGTAVSGILHVEFSLVNTVFLGIIHPYALSYFIRPTGECGAAYGWQGVRRGVCVSVKSLCG